MPEFKKKTALGLRDLPENGQECTHVLLTHSEYDGLLAKVACAERDARSVYTAASQKIAQAERNSAQAKEAAYAEVDAVQKDLEEACRKIEYLDGLNKNLLRIARERANADRKLRPKKTHTGYVVLTSSEKEYRYKTMRKETAVAGLWETALQSPYSVDFTEEQARALTEELVQPNENGETIVGRIGIDTYYHGSYEDLLHDQRRSARPEESRNIMLKPRLRANYKTGYWEVIFLHTRPLGICGRGTKNKTAGTVRTVPAVFIGSACGGGRPKAPWAVPSIPEIHRVGGTGPRQIIGRGSRRWA